MNHHFDIETTADAIMSARHSDAFNREACVKILRDNLQQKGGDAPCRPLSTAQSSAAPTVQSAGAAQPKPESWQEIAREAVSTIVTWIDTYVTEAGDGCSDKDKNALKRLILSAIERSHAAQPQRSDLIPEDCALIAHNTGEGWYLAVQNTEGDDIAMLK